MREIRTSGSEGGEPQANEASLPLSQRCEAIRNAGEATVEVGTWGHSRRAGCCRPAHSVCHGLCPCVIEHEPRRFRA